MTSRLKYAIKNLASLARDYAFIQLFPIRRQLMTLHFQQKYQQLLTFRLTVVFIYLTFDASSYRQSDKKAAAISGHFVSEEQNAGYGSRKYCRMDK